MRPEHCTGAEEADGEGTEDDEGSADEDTAIIEEDAALKLEGDSCAEPIVNQSLASMFY